MTDLIQHLKELIEKNDVVLFMKGTPDFPHCGFSAQVAAILKDLALDFTYLNVLEHPEVRRSLPQYSQWPTYPQLFIRGELIGGCDIVVQAYKDGEFSSLIESHNLSCQSIITPLNLGDDL